MGKFDHLLEKIGWAPAHEEEEDNETYEEPRSAVYSAERTAASPRSEIHFRQEEPEEEEPVQQAPYRPHRATSRSTASAYRESYRQPERAVATNPKVVNLHANVQMEVVVASPESFEEAKNISDDIRNNKPVVINLEFVEQPIAQRITDFLCGSCYALNGNIQRIADKIYMIAPGNVDIASNIDFRKTLQSEGGLVFPWGTEQ